jgi:hypothetical protein
MIYIILLFVDLITDFPFPEQKGQKTNIRADWNKQMKN